MSRSTERDRRLEDNEPYDRRIVGYMGGDPSEPWNAHCVRHAWQLLIHIWSDEDKAEFALRCHYLICSARAASNDSAQRKLVSDESRRLIWEIPARLPVEGYPDLSTWRWQYDDCLTADEIERRLLAEITRMDLQSWFELASKGGK